jgi:predicted ATP-grasp superfamily ATP-dependent carboligase
MPLKKTYPWNVLIFPAASEVGLEIARSLRGCKEVVVHGAVQEGLSVADFHFRHLHVLPRIDEVDCLTKLQQLVINEKIDAIFPAYDDVLVWLADRKDKITTTVIAPDAATTAICRSKKETYQRLQNVIVTPRLWDASDKNILFPVFVKPERGQGSQRARLIHNRSDLDRALAAEPDLIIMEYLPGREYTVDCFSPTKRGVLFASARERLQAKGGIAVLTQNVDAPFSKDWAQKISHAFHLHGIWFYQVKENARGEPCLLEVAPRVAGSMALSRVLGPNFPLLALYDAAGYELEINAFAGKVTMGRSLDVRVRFDEPMEALYIDLDDTLIIRGEVNTALVALIFQCRNNKIPVSLITRHKRDVNATLMQYRLAQLFDHIIHIPDDATSKANFIYERNAILIDDSFRERADVTKQKHIRCYDASGASCLLDDRV